MLALVIDRATSCEVSRINQEIGRSVYSWHIGGRYHSKSQRERLEHDLEMATRDEKWAKRQGNAEYESLLREYVQLKLYLHNIRKTLYYPYDSHTTVEDYKRTMARVDELKQQIKAKRTIVFNAAWGGLNPAKQPTDYDKPVAYSLAERTCSFWIADDEDGHTCPFNGEHWFRGEPYCRAHFHVTRYAARVTRRIESRRTRIEHWRRHTEGMSRPKTETPVVERIEEAWHSCIIEK